MKRLLSIFAIMMMLILVVLPSMQPFIVFAASIDYRVSAYNGEKINYGSLRFSRIRQYVFKDDFITNEVAPILSYDDSSDSNSFTRLINTTLGVSKMPLFSITKTTGAPLDNNTDLAKFYPDKRNSANKGAKAVMQYIKVPADMTNPHVSLIFVFNDKDYYDKNVMPYEGTAYYMERGNDKWVPTEISEYYFKLPKGFDGYIMLKSDQFRVVGFGNYSSEWTLERYTIKVANLNNKPIIISAPFLVEELGDVDNAAYIDNEVKAARDIFSGQVIVPKELNTHDCTFGEWVTTKAPTCTEKGVASRTCTECLNKETKNLEPIDHKFTNQTVSKTPTCTEAGKKESICTVCGEKIVQTISAIGHNYGEAVIEKEATETEAGISTKTCTVCGEKSSEEISIKSDIDNSGKVSDSIAKEKEDYNWLIWPIAGVTAIVVCAAAITVIVVLKKKPDKAD